MSNSFKHSKLSACFEAIDAIPSSELKYYLFLALHSIKKADAEIYSDFLEELTKLSQDLSQFLNSKDGTLSPEKLELINLSFQRLCNYSKTNTISIQVGYALINLGSALLAVFTGILGGLIGGVAGFSRWIGNLSSNPLNYLLDGVVTGVYLGAAFGFRTPKKLLKEELTRQLKFCLNGIERCLLDIQAKVAEPLPYYKEQIQNRLLNDCFSGNEDAYQQFLESEQTYKIITLRAQFLRDNLEGYLGHHACIFFSLPNQTEPERIEFSISPADVLHREFSQQEERKVTGKKIVDMMALHQQLQITHACTYGYILTKMKSGDSDCLSYIDKILVGTGQKATHLKRFDGSENWIGKNIVGFFIEELSPFNQNVLLNDVSNNVSSASPSD